MPPYVQELVECIGKDQYGVRLQTNTNITLPGRFAIFHDNIQGLVSWSPTAKASINKVEQ